MAAAIVFLNPPENLHTLLKRFRKAGWSSNVAIKQLFVALIAALKKP
jgi:hypothetical protein